MHLGFTEHKIFSFQKADILCFPVDRSMQNADKQFCFSTIFNSAKATSVEGQAFERS